MGTRIQVSGLLRSEVQDRNLDTDKTVAFFGLQTRDGYQVISLHAITCQADLGVE